MTTRRRAPGFGEATSWIKPSVETMEEAGRVRFDDGNLYYRKILEITDCALDQCEGRFLVDNTDMHPGLDCVDALIGTETMLLNMVDDPDRAGAWQNLHAGIFPGDGPLAGSMLLSMRAQGKKRATESVAHDYQKHCITAETGFSLQGIRPV